MDGLVGFFVVFAVLVVSPTDAAPSGELDPRAACPAFPNGQFKSFTKMQDSFVLMNPERGFYNDIYVSTSSYEPVDLNELLTSQTKDNVSVILLSYTLDTFVTSDISTAVLDRMTTDFQTIHTAHMKCIVRFAYTQTEGDDRDAVLPQLLSHITQLTSILTANSDVVFAVQAGFIGTWGEWYYSRNYATPSLDYAVTPSQQADRNTITGALLKAVPGNLMIQMRTPSYKQIYCNTTSNLSPDDAFDPTKPCSRIGIHNDCFMANFQDQGTFEDNAQRVWLTTEGLYTINGGESCETTDNTDCSGGIKQVHDQRFSYLNLYYHPLVIAGWKRDGCFEKIANMMGYRFELINGTFTTQVARGSTYYATIVLSNTGVAPLYNSRPVEVILRNRANQALSVFPQVDIDPRRWAPDGVVQTLCLNFQVPAGQAVGTYDVILNIRDASASLASQPLGRILMANAGGVQESTTRYNVLGQVNII